MNVQKLRVIIPLAVLLIAGLAFTLHVDFGTLSAAGWSTVSILCPLGALSAMLAAKLMIPRALVSLVFFVIIVLLVGRAFCAWACPVPVVSKVRQLFTKKGSDADLPKEVDKSALTEREKQYLRAACGGSCATQHKLLDSRHIVLGGSLLSAAIFGFPVFCLVCPIGLSFALIFFLVRAFGYGDPSWALLIIPVVLFLELVVFRKWCHWICPVSALMSLVAKGNKTVLPQVDATKCLETAKGVKCSSCAHVCPEGIDLHDPVLTKKYINECTRCHACVDVCPTGALSFAFLPGKADKGGKPEAVAVAAQVSVAAQAPAGDAQAE